MVVQHCHVRLLALSMRIARGPAKRSADADAGPI